jgi:hypothetical protein
VLTYDTKHLVTREVLRHIYETIDWHDLAECPGCEVRAKVMRGAGLCELCNSTMPATRPVPHSVAAAYRIGGMKAVHDVVCGPLSDPAYLLGE